ncbi:Crp/Fnr family transcriptional regulator [Flagellimonas flava]|uniref:cAMP-binding domain of CRP or a regulatory subunit of cAMP-dependent protein kinases n=1 Tax=Flagellimonas flava TaxID=570519 RepID=A0A1M5KY40_9FLAO|nr:Crp/Fnr family transcriptional regulator [Allomuricauda flava]SHG57580.1 cAMP-binding domain of CRP or a regulatory subunit of cAMP-dependent protein kinases [Allomuricauda flava]
MDAVDQLIAHLKESIPVTSEEAIGLRKHCSVVELRRRDVLLFAGETSKHMRFISKGCLRAYYMDSEAKEHIVQFGIEGWWINDLYSYLSQTPAKQFIQALEPSIVVQIQIEHLNQLFHEIPSLERFFRLKFEKAYVAFQERTMDAMSKTAEQRYLEFRSKYRNIEQRVPQYMVASYLGITPEFLSSLRKNIP